MTDPISNEMLAEMLAWAQCHDASLKEPVNIGDFIALVTEVQASRRQSPAGVVRGLEWEGEEGGPGKDICAAPSEYFKYTVRHLDFDTFDVILNTDVGQKWFREDGEIHASYSQAKAAAQADYQRRVLSCLSVEPVGVEPVAYRWRGPHGGWIYDVVKPSWPSEPVYTSPPPKAVTITDEMVERVVDVAFQAAQWKRNGPDNIANAVREVLSSEVQPTHRHKKRGSVYVLIGIGKIQADSWGYVGDPSCDSVDMAEVVIYRSVDDGSLWVRPREDFEDGRFEVLSSEAHNGREVE